MLGCQLADSPSLCPHRLECRMVMVLGCLVLLVGLWRMAVDNPFDLAGQLDIGQRPIAMDRNYGLMEHCAKENVMTNRRRSVDAIGRNLQTMQFIGLHIIFVCFRKKNYLSNAMRMVVVVRNQLKSWKMVNLVGNRPNLMMNLMVVRSRMGWMGLVVHRIQAHLTVMDRNRERLVEMRLAVMVQILVSPTVVRRILVLRAVMNHQNRHRSRLKHLVLVRQSLHSSCPIVGQFSNSHKCTHCYRTGLAPIGNQIDSTIHKQAILWIENIYFIRSDSDLFWWFIFSITLAENRSIWAKEIECCV